MPLIYTLTYFEIKIFSFGIAIMKSPFNSPSALFSLTAFDSRQPQSKCDKILLLLVLLGGVTIYSYERVLLRNSSNFDLVQNVALICFNMPRIMAALGTWNLQYVYIIISIRDKTRHECDRIK